MYARINEVASAETDDQVEAAHRAHGRVGIMRCHRRSKADLEQSRTTAFYRQAGLVEQPGELAAVVDEA